MLNKTIYFLILIIGLTTIVSCSVDDDPPVVITDKTLTLNINELEDVGENFIYENWLIVNGSPVSAGTFSVNTEGVLSKTLFTIPSTVLDNATQYVLTIEPDQDTDPTPSKVHVLAGDFISNSAEVSIEHSAALGTNFSTAAGNYILATPTNGMNTNEKSGVWWLDPTTEGGPSAGLTLPSLPEGWEYEGWAVIDGAPVSTGKFTSVSGADSTMAFSGPMGGPPFPGEDFLINAPEGLTFPLDLSGQVVVISVEPTPDTSPKPSPIKPLAGLVPLDAADHALLPMVNQGVNLVTFGSVSR